MRLIGRLAGILFFFHTVVYTSANADECLIIASDPDGNPAIAKYTSIVTKVFERANVCFSLANYPFKRMQANMKQGVIDGEFFRVKSYIDAMSDYVIPLPTPVAETYGYLVSLKKNGFQPSGIVDVNAHLIGVMHGHKWQDLLSREIKNTKKAFRYADLVKLLKEGVVEAIMLEKYALAGIIEAGLLKKNELHVSKPVIDLSGYIVLHKKHADLVKRLDPELKKVLVELRKQ